MAVACWGLPWGVELVHDLWGRGWMGPGCRWYVGVQLLVREVAGWLGELRVTDWPVRGNRVGRKWRNGLELPSGFLGPVWMER
jgi:hypothetical protein